MTQGHLQRAFFESLGSRALWSHMWASFGLLPGSLLQELDIKQLFSVAAYQTGLPMSTFKLTPGVLSNKIQHLVPSLEKQSPHRSCWSLHMDRHAR